MLRAAVLGTALLGLTACSPRETLTPIRLLELREGTVYEGPGLTRDELPFELRPAALGALGRAGAYEIDMFHEPGRRDSRAALLAPTPSTYRFRVTLPANALLRFATGYVPLPEAPTRRVSFRAFLSEPGDERVEIFEQLVETRTEDVWQEHEIDLGRWSGADVRLELATATADPATVWAAWGVPEIVSSDPVEAGGFDVILISLDTLRADHLGCYGYHRTTSPHLDALAAAGVRFATAVAQSPWTRPSHRSMLTGLYPVTRTQHERRPLPLVLWRAGYRTAAMTGGGQVDARFGFQTGFELFTVDDWLRSHDAAVAWLEAGRNRRDFLFLHSFEIHDPYADTRFASALPAGRVGERFSVRDRQGWARSGLTEEEKTYVEALYDGGIAFADERLGRFFAELERRDLLARAIVVVTSDHGEAFWEHGTWRHGTTMYDHQLLVPLILHLPEPLERELGLRSGLVVEEQVELVDLYPTLLDLLGIEPRPEVQGRSLRPLLEGGSLPPEPAFAENTNHAVLERKALRTARYKLVYSFPRQSGPGSGRERIELYDLREDPGEQVDLADRDPDLVRKQMEHIRAILAGGSDELDQALPEGLDPDLVERLKALGYVGN